MISNTSKQDPIINLMFTMGAGGIENQESQGQAELVASTQLPVKGDWTELEKMGVKPGEESSGDSLFRSAELPKGWEKKATDHSMWSELVDETGKVRATIFYKAAFYDRDAFITVTK